MFIWLRNWRYSGFVERFLQNLGVMEYERDTSSARVRSNSDTFSPTAGGVAVEGSMYHTILESAFWLYLKPNIQLFGH